MEKYPKIQTIFKRGEKKKIIEGDWTLPEFDYLQNNIWDMTEKIEGTNIRLGWNPENDFVTIDGRTDNASIPAKLVNHLIRTFPYTDFQTFDHPIEFYGEGVGVGIQGKYGKAYSEAFGEDAAFILFDIKVGGYWLKRDALEDISDRMGIPLVPIVENGTLHDAVELCREGFKSHFGDITAEGVVMKPKVEMRMRNGGRIIAKLKHRDF